MSPFATHSCVFSRFWVARTGITDTTNSIAVARHTSPSSLRFILTPSFLIALVSAGDAALGIYDLGGRLVRTLHRGRLAAGEHHFEWNGRDDRDLRAPAGVYFIRLETGGRHVESKLVKLR